MGSGYYIGERPLSACVRDWDYHRGPSGTQRLVVRYWAVVTHYDDAQRDIASCGHDHLSVDRAIRCRDRLLRNAIKLFKSGMTPDQLREAMKGEA